MARCVMLACRAVPPRLKAILLLALALVRTALRLIFARKVSGIARFRENYDADRFGRCIACGLCDRGESERIARSRGQYRGVMPLMLAASRSMPDFQAAQISFAHVPAEVLEEKERSCPTRVPMREIARFVRDKAAELTQSLPPPKPSGKKRRLRQRKPAPLAEGL